MIQTKKREVPNGNLIHLPKKFSNLRMILKKLLIILLGNLREEWCVLKDGNKVSNFAFK